MLPTLGHFGPVTFYTYTVLIDAGLAATLAWLYYRAPAGKSTRWLDAGLVTAIGAFTGARLLYIAVHGDYFFPHLGDIVRFWQGGLSWPGAAAGGALGLWLYCRRAGEPLGPIADALALPLALLSLLGWAGCGAAGCAYGFEVNTSQWPAVLTTHTPDLYGLTVPRFPTQAFGAAWGALALLLIGSMSRRAWPAGARSAYALSLVALGMFWLSFTRGDPAPRVSGFRLDTVGSALVLVAASVAWAWHFIRSPRDQASGPGATPPPPEAPPAPGTPVSADPVTHP